MKRAGKQHFTWIAAGITTVLGIAIIVVAFNNLSRVTPFSETERLRDVTAAALPDNEEVVFQLSSRCGPADEVLGGVNVNGSWQTNEEDAVPVDELVARWNDLDAKVIETDDGLEVNGPRNAWKVTRAVDRGTGQVTVRARGEFEDRPEDLPEWLQEPEHACG